jgi:hypothetical protein
MYSAAIKLASDSTYVAAALESIDQASDDCRSNIEMARNITKRRGRLADASQGCELSETEVMFLVSTQLSLHPASKVRRDC